MLQTIVHSWTGFNNHNSDKLTMSIPIDNLCPWWMMHTTKFHVSNSQMHFIGHLKLPITIIQPYLILTLWNCLYSYLVTILGIWQFLLLFSSNVYAQNSPFWRHYALISLMYLIPKLWGNMIFLSYVIIKDKNIRSKIFETFWHNLWSLQTFPKWQTGYYKSHMTFMYILYTIIIVCFIIRVQSRKICDKPLSQYQQCFGNV